MSPALSQIEARVLQAQAQLQAARAGYYPRLDLSSRAGRQQPSIQRPTYSNAPTSAIAQNDLMLGLAVSWELDLFGRVSADVDSASQSTAQAQADFQYVVLSLTADLASTYFNLRAIDTEIAAVVDSLAGQIRAKNLLEARHEGGAASGLEVSQQRATIEATRAQQEILGRQRQQYEHALATFVGVPASPTHLVPMIQGPAGLPEPPHLPLALPSSVLERRPDIVAAERSIAVASAQIGLARTAYFPSVVLGAGSGIESRAVDAFWDKQSAYWSFGATLAWNLFEGNRTGARVQESQATQQAAIAAYRQTVLRAFQEVEDALTGLQALSRARESAESAVTSTAHVLEIANDRYQGGAASYLEVITAQQGVLGNQRLVAQLHGQQLVTTALLAKALGGGFEAILPAGKRRASPTHSSLE